MTENTERTLQSMDTKTRKELENLGATLMEYGADDMRDAKVYEFKAPATTPLPEQQQTNIER